MKFEGVCIDFLRLHGENHDLERRIQFSYGRNDF